MVRREDMVSPEGNMKGKVPFSHGGFALREFNHPNFVPVGGFGNNVANYEVTRLTGTNTSRVIQLVSRINW